MSNEPDPLPRHLARSVVQALADTPVVVLQGARQVGKSTLARQVADAGAVFSNLDDPTARTFALADPIRFLQQNPSGLLVIDEAQRAPELVLAMKSLVDADRRPGRFLLTGSVDLLQAAGVADSLAGRKESLRVSPLSQGELERRADPEDFVTWLIAGARDGGGYDCDVVERAVRGGYPATLTRSGNRLDAWFEDYVASLSSHDASRLASGAFPDLLESLLRLLAAQGHSELVKARVARQLGVSESAAADYLRLAGDMFLTLTAPGWGNGFLARETRRPKIGLLDSGLAASLVGFTTRGAATPEGSRFLGGLIEGFVFGELTRQQAWSQTSYRLFHLRQRNSEVDIVVQLRDGGVVLIEVKSSLSVTPRAWRTIDDLQAELGSQVRAAVVLYGGSSAFTAARGVHVLPISAMWRHESL